MILCYLGGGDEDLDVFELFLLPRLPKKWIPPEIRFDKPTLKLYIALWSPSACECPSWCLILLASLITLLGWDEAWEFDSFFLSEVFRASWKLLGSVLYSRFVACKDFKHNRWAKQTKWDIKQIEANKMLKKILLPILWWTKLWILITILTGKQSNLKWFKIQSAYHHDR